MTTILRNEVTQKLLVHLTNAMTDDTEYEVHYSPMVDACNDRDYAPIRRGGKVLTLSPKNTPLLLEFVGTYRFENVSSDRTALILSSNVNSANYKHGDIMNTDAYTWEKE